MGLATAYQLLLRKPGLTLAVVEKENELASHQTGHNSGVIHAGLYYAPGSRKARLCREGRAALEKFALEHGIPFKRCGKLVVALEARELPRLIEIRERALANGVEGIVEIGPDRMREIEPHAAGIRALWAPTTGVIDFRRVALEYVGEVRSRGGAILTGRRVTGIERKGAEQVIRTGDGDVVCRDLVSCAGLHADRVAAMGGAAGHE
ncbi:MAG TPA: FAD-dependent oxidoreductase, partial [Thermoanaerobaculia bacterium]|nr:FAD-dependent oxidoreductase [Thermoanaerobaculia bacterium]